MGSVTNAPRPTPLPRRFFAREADDVARALIGQLLVHEAAERTRVARITETEAYFGPPGTSDRWPRGDPASHTFRGRTERNRVMWGPPGFAYVYLIYGVYECLNVSTGRDGQPQAVLLRAAEVEGPPPDAARGPGKLTRALGVTRADHYGHDLTTPPLYFARGRRPRDVAISPRVNVVAEKDALLRFYDPESASVSRYSMAKPRGRAARPPRRKLM